MVKFKPWSAGLFFDGIENLADQNIDLSCLVLQDTFYQTMGSLHNETNNLNVVKSFLLQQFNHNQINTSIINAIRLIENAEGKIRVDRLAYEVCHSKRNFERKFKSATGLSPKKFIDNIRFQHSLKRLQTNNDLQEIAFWTTTVTKTVNIKASPDKVWNFVSDLSQWQNWAIHNVFSSRQGDNGYWLMEGPRGTSKVKMNGNKTLGILDHEFIDPVKDIGLFRVELLRVVKVRIL